MDLQQAIILRDKTIAKQQEISSLPVPSMRPSRQELRVGIQGRTQRREHSRFLERVKKQKEMYVKQKSDLDKYISSLQFSQPVGDIGILSVTSQVTSPVPIVSFLGKPIQRRIRNIKQRGRR